MVPSRSLDNYLQSLLRKLTRMKFLPVTFPACIQERTVERVVPEEAGLGSGEAVCHGEQALAPMLGSSLLVSYGAR